MGKNSSRKWAIGAALAAVGGYVAGILTAPKSGKETRADIKKTADKAVTAAEKKLKKLQSELAHLLEEGRQKTSELQSKAKEELNKALDVASKTREKAREVLSSWHEGDADDKDLDQAIKDVNKALIHLKTYLKK